MKSAITAILASVAVLAPGAYGQQTKILTADKHNEYGLVYTLPNTALDITVTAEKTVRKAGPYFKYAKKYIGTDKVVKNDAELWTITDVKVTPVGVADPSQRYLMQLKAGALTYICVDDDGMLLAINREVEAPSQPAVSAAAVTTSGRRHNGREYLQYVGEDFIASQSSAKQAQMLAESLMEVRDAKISLTRGTADNLPTDGRQLELMLNSLSEQEEALTTAFIGSEDRELVTRSYRFMPERDGRSTLFRLSDFAGFVDADDYSGDPVTISVEITEEGLLPTDAKGDTKRLPKDAVVYNIPGTARIRIETQGQTLYDRELDFSQFGVQFGLAPSLFNSKKERSFVTFNPATGAIVDLGEVAP